MTKEIQSRVKDGDGLSLFVRRWHPAQKAKAVVVHVHGLGEHSGRYEHVAHAFCARQIAFVSFDLPGHGQSEGRRGHVRSYSSLLDDVHQFFQSASLSSDGPKFLYGQSMGGNLVLNYLLTRQPDDVAGAIVTSPLILPALHPPVWKTTLGRVMNVVWPSMTLSNGLDLNELSRDPKVAQAFLDDLLNHQRISARLGTLILRRGRVLLNHANELECEVLLMHGEQDKITCPFASERFAKLAGDKVDFRMWKEAKHVLHLELNREEVIEEMVAKVESWVGLMKM